MERERRLAISVISPLSPVHGVSGVSRENEKVVGRSGNTCPECVPDTVAARGEDERKIGTA